MRRAGVGGCADDGRRGTMVTDEAVSLPEGLDVARRAGIVAESFANRAHRHLEDGLRDVPPLPQRRDELVPADDRSRAHDEVRQHRERAGLERHPVVAPEEPCAGDVEAIGPEGDAVAGFRHPTP